MYTKKMPGKSLFLFGFHTIVPWTKLVQICQLSFSQERLFGQCSTPSHVLTAREWQEHEDYRQ